MTASVEKLLSSRSPLAIKALARTPQGRDQLARVVTRGSVGYISRAQSLTSGKRQRKPGRAARLARLVLKHVPGGPEEFIQGAVEQGIATAQAVEFVAARLKRNGDIAAAIRLRRTALAMDPDKAHRHLALASALQAETSRGVVWEPVTGLVRGQVEPHAEEILKLYAAARELAPGSPYIAFELGRRLIDYGETLEGLKLLEKATVKAPKLNWLLELAQAYRRPDVAQFDDALATYERAFRKDPKNQTALSGIIHAGARGPMDWERVWQTVRQIELGKKKSPYRNPQVRDYMDLLFSEGELFTRGDVASLLDALDHVFGSGRRLHPQTLSLMILRLQFLGFFSAGFALRTRAAQDKNNRLRKSGLRGVHGLRQLMKALIYLDHHGEASHLAEDIDYWAKNDENDRTAVRKLHADAEMMRGNLEPYFRYAAAQRKACRLPAENLTLDLVKDQRVAIVGPAATNDQLGEIIDEYDVVVRPNFNPEFIAAHPESMGSKTDIAYYSGQDMTKLMGDVENLVQAAGVHVVTARSFSYHAHQHRELPWLRFSRHDWSLSFHGSPLGIQRMIYDLLQFRPAEIGIFNSDFYTGSGEFAEGYRSKRSFGPGSFMNDLVVVHDLLMDFKFTQAMLRTGRVTAHGRAADVLNMTPDEYIKAVEKAGVLQ